MERRRADALLVLVLVQACHSVEEYAFRLWEVLPPARAVARALSVDPAFGFIVSNSLLVGFGLWCWAVPVRRGRPSATAFLWAWALVETANGLGHLALAAAAGSYFPGLFTAPLLIAAGLRIVLMRATARAA
jgi:hypothetical protein